VSVAGISRGNYFYGHMLGTRGVDRLQQSYCCHGRLTYVRGCKEYRISLAADRRDIRAAGPKDWKRAEA